DFRRFYAAQHAAEGRAFPPRGVAVEGVLVMLLLAVQRLVDPYQPRVVRITPGHRMVFELPEAPGEGDVFGARDVLVAEEQDPVFQQQGPDLGKERVVNRGY